MKKILSSVTSITLVLGILPEPVHADDLFVIDLGRQLSQPSSVSDAGSVVGGQYLFSRSSGIEKPISNGSLYDIIGERNFIGEESQQVNGPGAPCPFSIFPIPSGLGLDGAYAANAAGDAVGRCQLACNINSYFHLNQACGVIDGNLQQFTLPSQSPYSLGAALDISSSKLVAGSVYQSDSLGNATGATNAFLWSPAGGIVDIGDLLNDDFSSATSVESHGKTVGIFHPHENFTLHTTVYNYFLYDSATPAVNPIDLGEAGAGVTKASISDDGTVVGTLSTVIATPHDVRTLNYAARWSGSGDSWSALIGEVSGHTDAAFYLNSASDISPSGQYITGSMTVAGDPAPHGYLASRVNLGIPDISFDTDAVADAVVYRPAFGQWYTLHSDGQGAGVTQWGLPKDVPLRGRFVSSSNPSGADAAIWRPSNGTWYIKGAPAPIQFGLSGDYPVPADFDADGLSDPAVFRPYYRVRVGRTTHIEEGMWYIRPSSHAVFSTQWGLRNDLPVAEDYDGDGQADIAVFRPSNGTWYILRSSLNYSKGPGDVLAIQWGLPGDHPMPADYDGDGRADLMVWRPSSAVWFLCSSIRGYDCSQSQNQDSYQWGLAGDIPVRGDFNNDRRFDLAVFRPSTGSWYARTILHGTNIGVQWGLPTDVPVGRGILSTVTALNR